MGSPATLTLVAEAVADVWGVSMADLRGPRRFPWLVNPRHVAFALCIKHTDRSMAAVGRWFGDRDHTTVINGVRRFNEILIAADQDRIVEAERLIFLRCRATFFRHRSLGFVSARGRHATIAA